MRVEGACHCGFIRYEAEVDPAKVSICHCTDCQTLSGSTFRTVVPAKLGTFRMLQGALKIYVRMAESGNRREQAFCPECGTPIYGGPVGEGPKVVGLRVGTLRQRDLLVPKTQYWSRSSQNWLGDIAAIERLETQPAFDAKGRLGAD